MNPLSNLVVLLLATAPLAEPNPSIQSITLDDRVVVTVPVATNRVTTINFPSPISAIDAAGVTIDPKLPGEFLLAHTKGSSFVSVRSLVKKAAANLNIRWNKRTYVFELMESNLPVLALNLEERVIPTAQAAPIVSPIRLLALLDKAKSYPLLKQQHPASVAQVETKTFGNRSEVTDFSDYEIQIAEIFRFNPEDTLVFHVTLRNKSMKEIRYRPDTFAIRAGNRLYHQSISDAPGTLPANSESSVYFAITGAPDGGRNELSLKNRFSVFIERFPDEQSAPLPPSEMVPILPLEDQP